MMKSLKGIALHEFPFKELDKIADLIYFDGPLLSLFKNTRGDQYFFYWCDNDENANRWLVYRVTDQEVSAYLSKRISLRELLLHPSDGLIFSVDIDDDLNYNHPLLVKPNDLPFSYIPSVSSIYKFTPVLHEDHVDNVVEGYKIRIDGEWSLRDLSEMPTRYARAYSFLYFLQNAKQFNERSLKEFFKSYPWRGGYSSINFYNALAAFVLPEHQPQIASMQYASPGWIEINLSNSVAFSIRNAVTAFVASANELEAIYKEIYQELNNRGLLREPKQANENTEETPKVTQKQLPTQFTGMSEADFAQNASALVATLLRLESIQEIESIADSQLIKLKMLLSFYRRIKALAQYQAEGKAEY
jgi:hypothetical protein